ncbi:hypothetical protein [Novipirellula caenicola]|uniref:hypothetical protein n=1 Tax=Novipirellula caenicola TaxID=1536901 RepID=UPI0031EE199B
MTHANGLESRATMAGLRSAIVAQLSKLDAFSVTVRLATNVVADGSTVTREAR